MPLFFLLVRLNPYCFLLIRPDVGEINNTPLWKKAQPMSVRSIYVTEGDLGFFSYKKKNYGSFFGAANIFAQNICLPNS